MNAPTQNFALTDKQARTIIDCLELCARYLNKGMTKMQIEYIRKVSLAMKQKERKSSHGKESFSNIYPDQ